MAAVLVASLGLVVPGLAVPGLAVPGLAVPGLAVPGLAVPGLAGRGQVVTARFAPGDNCVGPGKAQPDVSWPQAMLTPEAVWTFTRGGGTKVAVLATGVDAGRPQLKGRVDAGFDAVAGGGAADTDCAGLGTQVAGVIAAQQATPGGFGGLAPGTTILPVRVVADDPARAGAAEAAPVARGISWAVGADADVVVVAAPVRADDARVRAAVADAVTRGIVVVAAAGDLGAPDDGNPTPYPAAYPDVLGVGAIAPNGQVWAGSQHGDYVDLVAPGVSVPTLQRGGGLTEVGGTAVAAGFVAGAAALMKAKHGALSAREVNRALIATASPAPLGPFYGAGVVNPYAAVTDQLADADARPLPGLAEVPPDSAPGWLRRRNLALAGAGAAVLAVVAVLVMAAAMRRGRRRNWRPLLAAPLAEHAEQGDPGPPVMLLDDPADTPAPAGR